MKLGRGNEWIIIFTAWLCGYLGYYIPTSDGWSALGASIFFPLIGVLAVVIINKRR